MIAVESFVNGIGDGEKQSTMTQGSYLIVLGRPFRDEAIIRRSILTLIVAGEDEPKAVSNLDAAAVRNERDR